MTLDLHATPRNRSLRSRFRRGPNSRGDVR
jgi:hypothetical protein